MLPIPSFCYFGVSVVRRLYLLLAQSALSTQAMQLQCCLLTLCFVSTSLFVRRLQLLLAQSALSTQAMQLECCLCPLFLVSASLFV
jgi:hypothetical protein